MLLCKRYVNKMAAMRYYGEVILHLQQYSRRLNLLLCFLSVLPGRSRGGVSHCTVTTTLHILFNSLFTYCPLNEHHVVGTTENV